VPDELRIAFHQEMAQIDAQVVQLLALVGEGLAAATDALLSGDAAVARALMERENLIDALYHDVERLVHEQFVRQSPVAADLRFLLTVLRIAPELERSHDLAEHIARRSTRGLSGELNPRVRGLIEQMGRVGVKMWRSAADAWIERNGDVAEHLDISDDELDDLLLALTAELVSGQTPVPVVLEMALIGRFYERLGDHAVNVCKRVRYLASGEL
jgi:phosphate transport system protein